MSTGALRQFISDRVDKLEYDDPSVKRVLTLIANKVTAKGNHVHQALQGVFETFGNWKFGSLFEEDFKAEILSVCGSFCPDQKHKLFQPADQPLQFQDQTTTKTDGKLQQPQQLQLQDQPRLKSTNGGGGGADGPVSGEGSQNGGVGGADGIVSEEQSQNGGGGEADGADSVKGSESAVPTGDGQQGQPPFKPTDVGGGGADGIVSEEQSQNGGGGEAGGADSVEGSGSTVPTGDGHQGQPPFKPTDGGGRGADGLVSEEQSQNGGGGGAHGIDSVEGSGFVVPRDDGQQDQPHPESTVPACVQDTGATNDSGSISERDQEEEQGAVHALNALRSGLLTRDAEEENGEAGAEDGAEGEEEEEEEGVERDRGKRKQARKGVDRDRGKRKQARRGEWTHEEHEVFLLALTEHGKDWERVAKVVRTRDATQIRTHAQKYHAAVEACKPFPAAPYLRQGGGNQSGEGMLKDGDGVGADGPTSGEGSGSAVPGDDGHQDQCPPESTGGGGGGADGPGSAHASVSLEVTTSNGDLQRNAIISECAAHGFCGWKHWKGIPWKKLLRGEDNTDFGVLVFSAHEHFTGATPMDIPQLILERNLNDEHAMSCINNFNLAFMMLVKDGEMYRATDETILDTIRVNDIHTEMADFLQNAITRSGKNVVERSLKRAKATSRAIKGLTVKYKDCDPIPKEHISAELYLSVLQEKPHRGTYTSAIPEHWKWKRPTCGSGIHGSWKRKPLRVRPGCSGQCQRKDGGGRSCV